MHVTDIVRLSMVSHIILDVGTKSAVEGMTEGIIAVTVIHMPWTSASH